MNRADQIVQAIFPEVDLPVERRAERGKIIRLQTGENCQVRKCFPGAPDVIAVVGKFGKVHSCRSVFPSGEGGVVGKSEHGNILTHRFGAVIGNFPLSVFTTAGMGVQIDPQRLFHHSEPPVVIRLI